MKKNELLFIIIQMVIILSTSCSKIAAVDEIPLEQKALTFFCDSLLYTENLFKYQTNTDNTKIYSPPFIDKCLYQNGLFFNRRIFTSGFIDGVSEPYREINSLLPTYYSDQELKYLQQLQRDYEIKIKNFAKKELKISNPKDLELLSKKEYQNARIKNTLYLVVNESLSCDDGDYVELSILDCTDDFSDFSCFTYEIFIIFNAESEVKDWFLNGRIK